MHYSGVFGGPLKWVSVRYNSGWGEPGDWHLQFSDETTVTIDNVETFKDQATYLAFLSADKYRDEVIRQNWSGVGNNEDVIARTLNFLGYDEASKAADEQRVEANKLVVFEMAQQIVDGMTLEGLVAEPTLATPSVHTLITDAQQDAFFCLQRIHVYDALKQGREVGIGWSNESFLRDFPDSPYVPRVKQLMKEME